MATRTHLAKQEEGEVETGIQARAADPGAPVDGQVWFNTTSSLLKFRNSGSTIVLGALTDASVTNAKLANMATQTIKGRTTAGSGAPEDLTATQATAILNAMVGDSGSGGTKGLVPAPASGDAAAAKFLKADGTWATPAGGGGGGSLQWIEDGDSPLSVVDNHMRSYLYADGINLNLYAQVTVPASYIAGKPIALKITPYSKDSTTKTMLMRCQSTLIRTGTDPVSSTTNQRTSTNSAISIGAGTVDIPQLATLDLTSASGQINSVSVSAGDIILVRLARDYANDTSTEDVYVPVYGAEVTFS